MCVCIPDLLKGHQRHEKHSPGLLFDGAFEMGTGSLRQLSSSFERRCIWQIAAVNEVLSSMTITIDLLHDLGVKSRGLWGEAYYIQREVPKMKATKI